MEKTIFAVATIFTTLICVSSVQACEQISNTENEQAVVIKKTKLKGSSDVDAYRFDIICNESQKNASNNADESHPKLLSNTKIHYHIKNNG